ncbi:xanthine dehydrogenase family protein molybdopterin-binding subunit [Paratissierella segnis]|uniref:Xanthine dehydrogenase family protein molybdopterin-binding subunit n=1 Tax=Paratissierella segnis TaxID=2763679 RepID=A0A926F001_9FIRM|nr:xanthine dehydrogenase family protein molybdopterin-binding subunit [Paratissierella segnis]MBC8589404.1 xanthine dehydrogenase family protein molybdopterin-binding subunit [Paratissierella segnis]
MEKPKIGVDTKRLEAWDKVTGTAKYNADFITPDTLHAVMLASPYAHAKIKKIDIKKALKSEGVLAVITGEDAPYLTGSMIHDRPPIARDRVRYFGEPVAVVVANTEEQGMKGVSLIDVKYEELPAVNKIKDAIKENPILIHKDLSRYTYAATDIYPKANTNIMDHVKIRKGNMKLGWSESDVVVESTFFLPQSDHIAMETRNSAAQIMHDGTVIINTSTQGPFAVKEELSDIFKIPEGKIIVKTPLVGGAFGGKATIQLEYIAYLASLAVGGKKVLVRNTREEDIMSSPGKLGVEGYVKIGATYDGMIKALECIYYVDCGAYADTAPRMAKSIASDCSGPYNIENIYCDSYSVYTNHGYTTSFRGFGHTASTFCIERILDKLAKKLSMDPSELRIKNAIKENDTSPTQDKITLSNTGDLNACINKLKKLINWEEGTLIENEDGMIKAKGMACLWKTSNSPTDATSGAIITTNSDGSLNLNFGATEIGPGMKTTMAMLLAEKLKMGVEKIHVFMDVNTQVSPMHWKTVASMTTFMVGNAVLKAADDLIKQLKQVGAIALKCQPEDLDVGNEMIYMKTDPSKFVFFKDVVHGYKYENGNAVWGEIIAKGNFIMRQLTPLDKETGKGKSGMSWTVGAQAVEIEYDPRMHTYRLIKAATVMDVGKTINPKTSKGLVMGGMNMGFGLATREEFIHDDDCILQTTSLRTYKVMRFGEQPEYIVDFVETPQMGAPFGARGLAEHGILGIPAAFANAMSLATKEEFDTLPIFPETIYKKKKEVEQ